MYIIVVVMSGGHIDVGLPFSMQFHMCAFRRSNNVQECWQLPRPYGMSAIFLLNKTLGRDYIGSPSASVGGRGANMVCSVMTYVRPTCCMAHLGRQKCVTAIDIRRTH